MRLVAPASHRSRMRERAALACVMVRFWSVVFPRARRELRAWRALAERIPDAALRAQATATLDSERLSVAGAALFATTAPRLRGPAGRGLVCALVAYQIVCDYLDTLAEQPSADAIANGARLHRALADAVGDGPLADHYALHAVRDDGGYLAALVAACREGCAALPAFATVRAAARREAARNEVQGINHAPAGVREPALRRWAREALAGEAAGDARWFELSAASSSSLAVLALIAAAADPRTDAAVAERVRQAYFPWVGALSTLLDSVADREADLRSGELNFASRYASDDAARERLATLTARAIDGARGLPRGERHVALIAGMIAMHTSEAGARLDGVRPLRRAVLGAADTPAMRPLLMLLRAWRWVRARGERAAADQAVSPIGQLTPVPPSPQ